MLLRAAVVVAALVVATHCNDCPTCSRAVCPSGFELTRNGECYKELSATKLVDARQASDDLKSQCQRWNALPVIVRNQEDHDYWFSVGVENRKKGPNDGNILLGLICTMLGRWVWADGSRVTYKPAGYDPELDETCDGSSDTWAYNCAWYINPDTNNWSKFCFTAKHDVDEYCTYTPQSTHIEPADPDCDNFSYDGADQLCYQVEKTAANKSEAANICRSFGATLASIHSDRENNFVRRLAVGKGMVTPLMIGATFDSSMNTTSWDDGSGFDHQNYAAGFPQPGSGACLVLQTNDVSGRWMNVDCDGNHPFACVRQTSYTQPACGSTYNPGDIIYNPGFPSDASTPCDFLLQADPGMLVEVKILLLEANSCCDRLILSEGGTVIANLTGDNFNGATFRTSSSNVMKASWQPQGAVNVRGMTITFTAVPK